MYPAGNLSTSLDNVGSNNVLTLDCGNQFYVGGVTVTPVPEPGTLGLMAAGLGMVGLVSRRRKALVRS